MWNTALAIALVTAQLHAKSIVCNADVLRQSWNLLALAYYGHSEYERGAFIIRDKEGHLFLSVWRITHARLTAQYDGPIPEGAVAITHTHPNWTPMASVDDMVAARRTGLPVYVVTRMMISITDGFRNSVVVDGDWCPLESSDQVNGGCDTKAAR